MRLTVAIFQRKVVMPANILQKNAGIFFDNDAEKSLTTGKPDFRNRKAKNVGAFFVPKRKLSYTEIFSSRKAVKTVTIPV